MLKTGQIANARLELQLKCNPGFTLRRAHVEVGGLLRSLPEE